MPGTRPPCTSRESSQLSHLAEAEFPMRRSVAARLAKRLTLWQLLCPYRPMNQEWRQFFLAAPATADA
jgi:hypothetical protein